ncbi:hypothetical protein ANCCEY_00298 [Ancylostoma ceylanicum]|uniref:Uncharacterized protein n=1 Tax=Ancylostoma ceylanicum TaxID=53326 RepID=A0A0D6M8U1_9BILA|nr:hypothetical protein ANCCEY_00298 [Ancylostoma ceylanicum]
MRLITYVKVLIELNRLRRTALNCRMSQSGQKYFETLLMAAEQEKQMGASDEKPNKIGEASTSTEVNEVKEKRLSTKTKRPSPSSSPEPVKAAPAAGQKPEATVIQTATSEVPLKKKKSEKKTDAKEPSATKPPHPIAQPTSKVSLPTNGENKVKKVEPEEQPLLGKKLSIPEADTKPPAPPKNPPAKEAAAEPDKVPATVIKSTSVKLRDRSVDTEDTKMKKKRATIASTSAQDTTMEFVPREDFSFDALKDKLIRINMCDVFSSTTSL